MPLNAHTGINRRRAITRIGLGVALVGGLTGAGVWLASGRRGRGPTLLSWDEVAMGLVPLDLATMRSLGRSFASNELPGDTPASRVATLFGTLPEVPDVGWSAEGLRWDGAAWTVPPTLERAVRDQFAAGRTVVVDSWVLSRLEATLCAIAALHATSTVPVTPNPVGA